MSSAAPLPTGMDEITLIRGDLFPRTHPDNCKGIVFLCIHRSRVKPGVFLKRKEDFWGREGFGDVLARARRAWYYYARVMHAGFWSFPAERIAALCSAASSCCCFPRLP